METATEHTETGKTVTVQFREFPESLNRRLKAKAAARGRKPSEVAAEILDQNLPALEPEPVRK